MDIGGLPNKIIGGVEKHATALAFGGGVLSRFMEAHPNDLGGALNAIIMDVTSLNVTPVNSGAQGMLDELLHTIQRPDLLMFKLFQSDHLYSTEVKIGIAGWIAGELGILPHKYASLAKKIAIGGGLAAIVSPGSAQGSHEPNSGVSGNSRGYSYRRNEKCQQTMILENAHARQLTQPTP